MNSTKVSRLPYYRMAGYLITIVMHSVNSYVMLVNFREDVMEDPKIQLFASFMCKFITCWNFGAQVVHAVLGLSSDLLTLTVGDQYKFLKHVKQARDLLFDSIVVPFTLMVFVCFWPLFIYDRELVLPYYTTKIVNSFSNHVIHSAILLVIMWEMIFQPRRTPTSHKYNIGIMLTFAGIYLAVIFPTFFEIGIFPYPLMTKLYGSVYFLILMTIVILFLPIFYYAQWSVSNLIWCQSVKKHA